MTLSRFDKDDNNYCVEKKIGYYNFGVMLKVIYQYGDLSVAISMYSKFISFYEYLSCVNVIFWHISDGETYLYIINRRYN